MDQVESAFAVTISGTAVQYVDAFFLGNETLLVRFDYLLGIPFLRTVAPADYVVVSGMIKDALVKLDMGKAHCGITTTSRTTAFK